MLPRAFEHVDVPRLSSPISPLRVLFAGLERRGDEAYEQQSVDVKMPAHKNFPSANLPLTMDITSDKNSVVTAFKQRKHLLSDEAAQ